MFLRQSLPTKILGPITPVWGKIFPTDDNLEKEFTISLEMCISKFLPHWASVLRLTNTENDCCQPGDRIPMIAMRESKFLQFMFEKIRYDYHNVSIDEWHNVKISQTKQGDGSYKYQLEINNEIVQEKKNENAQEYSKVKLFIRQF